MKRIFLPLTSLLILAAIVMPHASDAADISERIENFVTTAKLEQSGVLTVHEAVTYDFGTTSHHGIYRVIPTQYKDDNGKTYRLNVIFDSATIDGHSVKNQASIQGSSASIKIGDPDVLVSGRHTYRLHYRFASIATAGDRGDILKLNLTGNGWEVPIRKASATIDFGDIKPTGANTCYTGAAGDQQANCTLSAQGSIITVASTRSLEPGEGLSAFVELPINAVSSHLAPYIPARPSPLLFIMPTVIYGAILACMAWLVTKQLAARRVRKNQTIVAQYEAPAGLAPIELGLLNDDRTGLVEITATLVDLAVRGHIKITQTQPKKLLSSAKYEFDRLDSTDTLRPHETQLLAALFGDTSHIKLSDVDHSRMEKAVTKINSDTGQALTNRNIYKRTPGLWRVVLPIGLLAMAFLMVNFSGILLLAPDEFPLATPFYILCGISALLTAVAAYFIKQPAGLTPEGAKTWAEVRGFKLYLTVAEKDRLNFSDAPAKTPELFNKLLPSAIALGVEKQWAKQFEGIDVAQASGWYGGATGYSAAILASSLQSDFASGISQNFTTTSSSGSSGGGFSGGGFGGGGGGSW